MRRVTDEMKGHAKTISEEFALANLQLQMGRPRREVLHDLGVRTGVDDVRSLAAILIQADRFGSSVAQALRVQSDSMRVRRRQIAEEKAAKTAVQMLFPLRDRTAYLKLTTSHYYLPSGRCIHREENSTTWGVDPDVLVEMTGDQKREAINTRTAHGSVAPPLGGRYARSEGTGTGPERHHNGPKRS